MPRREAEDVAKALQAGQVLPDFTMPWQGDLSTRVRMLVSSSRREEARIGLITRGNGPDLGEKPSPGDRECPLLTALDGPLMARLRRSPECSSR